MITPELVRPIPVDAARPTVAMPKPFLKGPDAAPRTPGEEVTGPAPVPPVQKTIPVEQLLELERQKQAQPASLSPPSSGQGAGSSFGAGSTFAPASGAPLTGGN